MIFLSKHYTDLGLVSVRYTYFSLLALQANSGGWYQVRTDVSLSPDVHPTCLVAEAAPRQRRQDMSRS